MKLTAMGKLALFLVAAGVAFGGWRAYEGTRHKLTLTWQSSPTSGASHSSGNAPTANEDGASPTQPATNASAPIAANEIVLVTNPGKRGWLDEQIDKFNAQSDVKIELRGMPTRDAMHSMLDQNNHPALWSPSSIIWADRLSDVTKSKRMNVLDTSDPASYRSVLRSPLVFLTTKEKAAFLKPLLSGPNCWTNMEALSTGKKKCPWGAFKWAHADPLLSNSGTLTLALILSDYANRMGQSAAIEKLSNDAAFLDYFKRLEKSAAYDGAVQKGSSALIKSFSEDPSRYNLITAYEAQAMSSVSKDPSLAVIYPTPTANAESAVAFLDWGDATPQQKTAAQNFLKFVAQPPSAVDGVKEFYRPARGASLNDELGKYSGNGFQVNYSSIELPPYNALNSLAYKWSKEIAGK